MNPLETIRIRKSCRTYLPVNINEPERAALLDFINHTKIGLFGESLHFQLIEHDSSDRKKMKNDYGLIVNHRNYLMAQFKDSADSRLSYGYLLEKIILKAVSLGIDTCWMGLFDPAYFPEIKPAKGETIPAIVILGYATIRRPLKEKIIRMAVKASVRKHWNSLFFISDFQTPLNDSAAGKYAEVLEMTRLSPSAGNTQPWRVVKEIKGNTFHFYKQVVNLRYDKRGLHDVDLGISISHFELSAGWIGLEGAWLKQNPGIKTDTKELEYKISWIGK
jgi:nitroreductase